MKSKNANVTLKNLKEIEALYKAAENLHLKYRNLLVSDTETLTFLQKQYVTFLGAIDAAIIAAVNEMAEQELKKRGLSE